jgi:multidrug efflux pump subunit AcrB
LIAWFARNHVAANLLMLTIVALGLGSLKINIPLEVFPSIEPRVISVSVAVPGALPQDIETSVAIKIEESVQDLEGIEQITSRSNEGSARVSIEVDESYDARAVLAEVKNRVDAINNLPADAERATVSLAQYQREVISLALAGNVSELELRQEAERIQDDLLSLNGVSQVELDGVRNYEVAVYVSEQTLQRYGLTLSMLADRLRQSSLEVSAGTIKTQGGEVLLRSSGQAYTKQEFEQLVVQGRGDGSLLRLGDIAEVSDGFVETRSLTRFNGQPAAMIEVFRVGKESAIDVADKVIAYVEAKQLPNTLSLTPWRDRSKIVKKRIKTLTDNAIQGGILVMLLLTLFLRPAIAFWVCIGIPVSFMGAFLVMPLFDVTINIISLFGFIVILGIVVDDAIVTGENIYSHLRRSENSLDAVINGTKEVAVPVTFGILTTIAAFLPIAFIEGTRGQLFAAIPVVVIPILLFSLIESKLILPAHLKHIRLNHLRGEHEKGRLEKLQEAFADGFEAFVLRFYQPLLVVVLKYRYAFLALCVGMLLSLTSLLSTGWMKFVFFPKVQSELARGSLSMPTGTPIEITDTHVGFMLEQALVLQQKYVDEQNGESVIKNIMATSGTSGGSSGSHIGRVMFEITPPEERRLTVTSRQLVNEWRALVGQVPGAESLTYRAEIGRVSDPIDIELKGQSFDELRAVAEQIKSKLATYPTVFDIEDSFSNGKQALQLTLKREAYALGLTRQQIVRQVREAFYGLEVQRIQRGRDDIKVMLRYPLSDRVAIRSLDQFLITNTDGTKIPLSQLVEFEPEISPASIIRIDRNRTINVRADIDKQNTNMLVLQEELRAFINETLNQYPSIRYQMEGEAKEQRQSFGSLQYGLVFVGFIIYCLLAIPFKSYFQPLIVMAVIPFGAIGAIGGHWIMGMDLTLISLLGMLALIGIIVNDSLVLVDFINKRRAQGKEILDTVTVAAAARFRPVILTSLTTFFGLMPLLFEKSTQAQFLIPMAVSLGFGILFATFITLLMVPVNYIVIEDAKRTASRIRSVFRSWLAD